MIITPPSLASDPIFNARPQSQASIKANVTNFSGKLQDIKQSTQTPYKGSNQVFRCIRNLMHFFASIRSSQGENKNADKTDAKCTYVASESNSAQPVTMKSQPERYKSVLHVSLSSSTDKGTFKESAVPLQMSNQSSSPMPPPLPPQQPVAPILSSPAPKTMQSLADGIAQLKLNHVESKKVMPEATQTSSPKNCPPPPPPPLPAFSLAAAVPNIAIKTQQSGITDFKFNHVEPESQSASAKKTSDALVNELKSRLAKIRAAVVDDKLPEAGATKFHKAAMEIAESRKLYYSQSEVRKREEADNAERARVNAAFKAETIKNAQCETKLNSTTGAAPAEAKSKEFISNIKYDSKGIPLPPPMPSADTPLAVLDRNKVNKAADSEPKIDSKATIDSESTLRTFQKQQLGMNNAVMMELMSSSKLYSRLAEKFRETDNDQQAATGSIEEE